MILNNDKRFMIFLPWKTAGSTMFARMSAFNQSPYSRFYYFNEHLRRVVHQHITVADFKAMPESLLSLKKVAFVRNPYDRVYSGFLQIQKDLREQPLMPFPEPWIRQHVMKQLALNQQRLEEARYDFDRWISLMQPEDVYQTGGNSSLPLHPAHYWTHDSAAQYVDFIGKVENFETDFLKMLAYLGISDSYTFQNDNVNLLPDAAAASEYKYTNKMSKNSIDKISMLFADDLRLFGYRPC